MAAQNETTVGQNETLSSMVECHGVILFTKKYEECVSFYRCKLGLPLWYEKDGLTCLRFGSGYLMIENGGVASDARKALSENPTALRFNVPNVKRAACLLELQGVPVDIREHTWGITGSFIDPDGNVCSLKNADDPYFTDS